MPGAASFRVRMEWSRPTSLPALLPWLILLFGFKSGATVCQL
jgi:hypothetical protein